MNNMSTPPPYLTAESESSENISNLRRVRDMTAWPLLKPQILTALALLSVTGGVDVGLNHLLFAPIWTIDPRGHPTGDVVTAWLAACLMACGFLLAGAAHSAGWKWVARILGALIFAGVFALVAPMALSIAATLLAAFGLDDTSSGDSSAWSLGVSLLLQALAFLLQGIVILAFSVLFCSAGTLAAGMEVRLAKLFGLRQLHRRAETDLARHLKAREPMKVLAALTRVTDASAADWDKGARQTMQAGTAHLARQAAAHRAGKPTAAAAVAALALLLAATALPAAAQTDDPATHDATLMVLLDNSKFSAARDPSLTGELMQQIEPAVNAMELGSVVIVASIGSRDEIPLMQSFRLLTMKNKEGMTKSMAVSRIRKLLRDFATRPHPASEQTGLVRGIQDAARQFDPQAKGNQLIFVSDMLEGVDADCSRVETCHLPDPGFTLTGAHLRGIGIGLGQTAANTQSLFREWKRFFEKAGMHVVLSQNF